jgi:HD-GYP domain-containing protein (c-di-GMP phosphodiesterase class II)
MANGMLGYPALAGNVEVEGTRTPRLEHLVADDYTAGHSRRVAEYASELARVLGLGRGAVIFIRQVAFVHDLGKIGIPEQVLSKPGPLTDDERSLVHLHTVLGANILARTPGMEKMAEVVLHHHERWDGAGYPEGRMGTTIPLESRVIFVADAFDAMTSERPYGRVMSPQEALAELRRCAGKQFDPMVVEAMHELHRLGVLGDIAAGHR